VCLTVMITNNGKKGPLSDAFAKLSWADVHIKKLLEEIRDAGEVPTQKVTAEDGLEPPYEHLRRILLPEVPTRLAFITADAIHNIRTALDYLMSALAAQNGNRCHPTFPICESQMALRKNRSMRFVAFRARAFLRSVRPYKGGCDMLWWLHKIDIIDKHRKLNLLEHAPPSSVFVRDKRSGQSTWYMEANYWLEQRSGAPRVPVVDLIKDMRKCVGDILSGAQAEFFSSTCVP